VPWRAFNAGKKDYFAGKSMISSAKSAVANNRPCPILKISSVLLDLVSVPEVPAPHTIKKHAVPASR